MLIIRGHHLLCLRYFQGKGYSKKFVEKMGGIESSLKSNPRQKIVVINSCDAICDSCPHQRENKCCRSFIGSNEEAEAKDNRILSALSLKPGDKISFTEVQKKLEALLKEKDLVQFCGECSWLFICLKNQASNIFFI